MKLKNDFRLLDDEDYEGKPKRKRKEEKERPASFMRWYVVNIAAYLMIAALVLALIVIPLVARYPASRIVGMLNPATPYPTATFAVRLTQLPLTTIPAGPDAKQIDDMVFSPANNLLAVSSWEIGQSNIQLMDLTLLDQDNWLPQQIISWPVIYEQITDLTLNADGTLLAATGMTSLQVWDVPTGRLLAADAGRGSPSFAPVGRVLAFAGAINVNEPFGLQTLMLLNLSNGKVTELPGVPSAYGVSFSPDGQKLAVSDNDRVMLWDITNEQSPEWIQVVEGWIQEIAFGPDGSSLAVVANNQIVVFTAEGDQLFSLQSPLGDVWGIAFSPVGTRLAAAVGDNASGMGQVWDTETGLPVLELQGHDHRVTGIAYNADGTRLITSSYDGSIRLWDTATGAELSTLQL